MAVNGSVTSITNKNIMPGQLNVVKPGFYNEFPTRLCTTYGKASAFRLFSVMIKFCLLTEQCSLPLIVL